MARKQQEAYGLFAKAKDMKRLLQLVLLSTLLPLASFGQTTTPFRQFYFNPYLANPAFTGINGAPELYLVYRKQWMNVNDAPTTMGVNLQYPTKKRVSLGLNIISDEVVALRNTTVLATFAYAIPLTSTQTLRFGISGGVGMNDLNLKEGEYDPNDPLIINAAQNSFYMDGNFGAVYTNKGFRLGFALTQLFESSRFSQAEFSDVKFSSLDNRLYSVGYKFPVGAGAIAVEPYFLFRQTADNNYWEAASVVYFKDKIWAGASYHQTNGMGFFVGLNIKELFRLSYSYELPPVDNAFPSTNSHELQLALRIGKKRDPMVAKKSPQKVTPLSPVDTARTIAEKPVEEAVVMNEPVKEEVQPQIIPIEKPAEPVQQEVVKAVPEEKPAAQPVQEPVVEPVKTSAKPPRTFSLAKGHYVVAGAFKIMQNAIGFAQDLALKGYGDATVAINDKNNLYYVYIFSSYDLEEARKIRNQYRVKRPFSEIWIFSAE